MTQREKRAAQVAAGNCGLCNRPHGKLAFLCDECARKHRERQRGKPKSEALYLTKRRQSRVAKLLAYLLRMRPHLAKTPGDAVD